MNDDELLEKSKEEILRGFNLLLKPSHVYELRVPHTCRKDGMGTLAGWFNNFDAMAERAAVLSANEVMEAVYFTLNPTKLPVTNRLQEAFSTTKGIDTKHRFLLLIDSDPIRGVKLEDGEKISSSDAEHELAIAHSKKIRQFLTDHGWPDSLLGDSGNGGHNIYAIDLPCNSPLVKELLDALADNFDDGVVEVDRSVSDPNRICKVYGTMARKGDNLPDRPWRQSKILDAPAKLETVTKEQIQAVIAVIAELNKDKPQTAKKKSKEKSSSTKKTKSKSSSPMTVEQAEAKFKEWNLNFGTRRKLQNDGEYKWDVVCPWCNEHTSGDDGSGLSLIDGKPGFHCFHAHCGDRTIKDLYEKNEPKKGSGKKGQAEILIELARSNCALWHADDIAYATIDKANYAVKSSAFRGVLSGIFYNATGKAVNRSAQDQAIEVLNMDGLRGESHKVHYRYAKHDDRIYVDLGGDKWDAIEIDKEGWRIVENVPVKFRRSPNQGILPYPKTGGSIQELQKICASSDEGFPLVLGWLLDCMKGNGPYIIGIVGGEHGSAKSTLCRIMRALIDPLKKGSLNSLPREEKDLGTDGMSEFALVYDNISFVPEWLSDALCRVSTGGGIKCRKLYSDGEQMIYDLCNPILLNGIKDFATRPDLVDRSVFIQQPRIELRLLESHLNALINEARPRLLGVLYSLVSHGLANQTIRENLPRMADSANWICNCLGNDKFIDAYNANKVEANEIALEESPIWECLESMLKERKEFTMTAAELYRAMICEANTEAISTGEYFPKNPKRLADQIRTEAPLYRSVGVVVKMGKSNGIRKIEMKWDKTGSQQGRNMPI